MRNFSGIFVFLFFVSVNCFAECKKLDSHALESFASVRVKEKRRKEIEMEERKRLGESTEPENVGELIQLGESNFYISERDASQEPFTVHEVISWSAGFSEGLAKIVVDGKSGFINAHGSIVIEPQFTMANCFSNDLAAVEINGKWGFINHGGDLVIPAKFDAAANFSENLALVGVGKLWGFIDKTGRFVIEPKFERAASFQENLANVAFFDGNHEWKKDSVKQKGKWRHHFIDKQGKLKFQQGFSHISRNFSGGMAIVARDVECIHGSCWESYIIDKNIEELWKLKSSSISWFSDDLIVVAVGRDEKTKFDKYSFLNRNGERVTNDSYDYLYEFSEGLAAARIGNNRGFINKKGEFYIQPQFSSGGSFSEGLAGVEKSNVSGFINKRGNWVFKIEYDWTGDFHEGRAAIAVGDNLGYIDKTGKYIWKLSK